MIGLGTTLVLTLAAASPQPDDGCGDVARLSGPPGLVRAVGAALRRQGVQTDALAHCPAVRVDLRKVSGKIALRIVDPYGRRSEGQATTPGAAATLIETWVLPAGDGLVASAGASADAGAGAGAGSVQSALPTASAAPRESAPAATDPDPDVPGRLAQTSATNGGPGGSAFGRAATDLPPLSLAIAGETGAGTDRSLGLGFNASGCVRVGRVCVGALFRLASTRGTGVEPSFTSLNRFGVDLLLNGSLSFHAGPVVLTPSLGVGLGWIRSRGTTAITGKDPVEEGGDEIEDDGGGVRADAALTAALPVSRVLAVTFTIGAGLVPIRPVRGNAEGTLPAEPWGIARAGLGLRWGAP